MLPVTHVVQDLCTRGPEAENMEKWGLKCKRDFALLFADEEVIVGSDEGP